MKLSVPRTFNRTMSVMPPIELKRPHAPKFNKDQVQTFKCRVDPTKPDSSPYDISVPYFSAGLPEEWIYFLRCLERAFKGQGDTTGTTQYAKVRLLLLGEALSAFEFHVATTEHHTETKELLKLALSAVADTVFPKRAAQIQRRYVRRFLRKPANMTTKSYVAQVVEINNFSAFFPRDSVTNAPPTKLPTDKLVDIL